MIAVVAAVIARNLNEILPSMKAFILLIMICWSASAQSAMNWFRKTG